MKIRNLIQKEFKIANQPPPKDKADYKAKMSTIQDLQKNPKLRDPESQANIMKRKAELDTWAKKNLKKEDTNEGEMRMDRTAFVQMLANKIQEPQKGLGKKEYDNRLLAKMYELITGKEVEFQGDKFTINMDKVSERMPASIIKHKEKLAYMSDKELANHFKDKDDDTLRQMAWRHGYGKMSDYYVNRKNKGMSEDADIDAQFKSDVLQFLNSKVVQIEKQIELAPAKTPEEKENKEFALKLFNFVQAKLEQKDNGDNTITVPKSMMKKEDLDYRSEDILNKAGFDPADIDTYMKVFNDHGDTTDIKQMNMKEKVGLADVMSIVLASHGIQNK